MNRTAKPVRAAGRRRSKPREGERQTLSATLRHALESEIFQGQLVPGQRLDEQGFNDKAATAREEKRQHYRDGETCHDPLGGGPSDCGHSHIPGQIEIPRASRIK